MKKITNLLLCLFIQVIAFAQEPILSEHEIESNERKVINAFEKFSKKGNQRHKQDLITHYNKSASEHQARLKTLYQIPQLKNWEGMLNELKSLQYLNKTVNTAETALFIEYHDYSFQIDSITNLAVTDLYGKGKTIFEKNESPFAMEIAYNCLKRVKQIQPDYKDTQAIMDLAVLQGTKNVFFKPVVFDNLGNYIELAKNNISGSSDFIINKLRHDLSVDNVGSRFINSEYDANTIIELKWNSINIAPENNFKTSVTRSKKLMENGQEKTVTAIVNYNKRNKAVSGQMYLSVKDVKSGSNIVSQNISGNYTFSAVEATYTGDKRALTIEDLNTVNQTNPININLFNTNGYQLATKLYENSIHQRVLESIGRPLNWNYQNLK